MDKKIYALALALIIVGAGAGIYFFYIAPEGLVSHSGEIEPQVEPIATDDTTDIDAAGTWEMWSFGSDPRRIEPILTWGTDTQTDQLYASGTSFWFMCKSTTANAMDIFTWGVTLPFSLPFTPTTAVYDGPLYHIEWDEANTQWDITFKGAKEDTPTLVAYTAAGAAAGATDFDLSDNNYVISFNFKIAIAANYGGLFTFFDPEEGENGEFDNMYLIMTNNLSAANAGYTIDSPWQQCESGDDYYLDLTSSLPASGILIRWDQEQMTGVINLPWTVRSSDIDTSGTGACRFTFNVKECNGDEQARYQSWETDTLTNLAGSVTAETIDVSD